MNSLFIFYQFIPYSPPQIKLACNRYRIHVRIIRAQVLICSRLNPNSADTESIPMTQRQGNERKSRRDEKDEESRTMKQV